MKLSATNEVRAKSKFWYFLRKLKKVKKSNGQMLAINERDTINQILRYASKNRLPESLKEQMLANMQLKFRTAELQQEEVLEDLPKAIRSSIAHHLFHGTVENAYLFKGVSEDLIIQLMSEMKAEYFPPKVDIILQNEIPTDFYILVSGAVDVVIYKNGTEKFLSKLGAADMAGEIGVLFNIPQPFTVRTKRLSQVIQISHHQFKQMVQPHNPDGKIIISNFIQYLKGLKNELLEEMPFVKDLLDEFNTEIPALIMLQMLLSYCNAKRMMRLQSIESVILLCRNIMVILRELADMPNQLTIKDVFL